MNDALAEVLSSVRMKGSVFSQADLGAPWAVESGELTFGIFHAVVEGSCFARHPGMDAVRLEPGDLVLLPFGTNHVLSDRPDGEPKAIGFEGEVDDIGMGRLVIQGPGAHTTLLCGTIEFEPGSIHPMLSQLPKMLVVSRASDFVATCIEQIAQELARPDQGSATAVARLTDLIVVYALRSYIQELDTSGSGWMRALRDPHISRSLALIHAQPDHSWTVDELAGHAGMSRSAFFSTFRRLVGETPGQYLTRWRVHVAAKLLREDGRSVATAGRMVGYATEAGFSNAFLRLTGVRPGAYRRDAA